MFDISIIMLGLVLFSVLAFKKINALILGPLVSLIVIVLARLPIFNTMLGPYMESTSGYVKNFFLVFFVGAIFGAVMDETRAAESIARSLVKITRGKYAAPIVMVITGLLTYGGISGFVIFFAMYPIALRLFKNTNVSRRLIPAAISAGAWTWSMSGPGSPAIQNIIPMRYLGTSGTAAFTIAVVAALAQLILIFVWLEYRSKSLRKKGYNFNEPGLTPINEIDETSLEGLPNPIISAIPAILILVFFNIIKLPVEGAVSVGIISGIVLLWKQIGSIEAWIQTLNKGAANSAMAILNTAIVVGFAGVVGITTGFEKIISGLKTLKLPPLAFVAITTAVAAGAAGSASGGLGIAYETLKQTYIDMGLNLEHVHRISVIAAGTLDTLPHQGAQITLLAICGLSHKEGYFDIAVTQLLIPILVLFTLAIPMASLGF